MPSWNTTQQIFILAYFGDLYGSDIGALTSAKFPQQLRTPIGVQLDVNKCVLVQIDVIQSPLKSLRDRTNCARQIRIRLPLSSTYCLTPETTDSLNYLLA